MNTDEKIGADLHGGNTDVRKEAARLMGQAKTQTKLDALAKNREKFTGHTEESKARIREAQQARRRREKEAKEVAEVKTNEPDN